MPKNKSGFKRVIWGGECIYVKQIADGGEVRRDKNEFTAYDKDKHYLGFCATQDQAEAMAFSGSPNVLTVDAVLVTFRYG